MGQVPKSRRPAYAPPSALDQRVSEFDGVLEGWLNRLQAYVSRRWPRLGRWLAG